MEYENKNNLEFASSEDFIQKHNNRPLVFYSRELLSLVIKTIDYSVYADSAEELRAIETINEAEGLRSLQITYPFVNDMFFYSMLADADCKNDEINKEIMQYAHRSGKTFAESGSFLADLDKLSSSSDFRISEKGEWEICCFSNAESSLFKKYKDNVFNVKNYINTTELIPSIEILSLFWDVFPQDEQTRLQQHFATLYEKVGHIIKLLLTQSDSNSNEKILQEKKRYQRLQDKLERILKISSTKEKVTLLDKISADVQTWFCKLSESIKSFEPLDSNELNEGLCLVKLWLKLLPANERKEKIIICQNILSSYLDAFGENKENFSNTKHIKNFLGKLVLPFNLVNSWMWPQIAHTEVCKNFYASPFILLDECTVLHSLFSQHLSRCKIALQTAHQESIAYNQESKTPSADIKQKIKNAEKGKSILFYCCLKLADIMNKKSYWGIPPFSLQGKIDREGKTIETKNDIDYLLYTFAAETYLHFTSNCNGNFEECYKSRQYIEGRFDSKCFFQLIADNCNKLKQYFIPRRKEISFVPILESGDAENSDDDFNLFDKIPVLDQSFEHTNFNNKFIDLVKEYDAQENNSGFYLFFLLYWRLESRENIKHLIAEFKNISCDQISFPISETEGWNMKELYTFLYDNKNFDTRYVANNLLSLAVFIKVEKKIDDFDEILQKICRDYWNTARGKAKSNAEKSLIRTILNKGD